MNPFGSKTGVLAKEKNTLFWFFLVFWGSSCLQAFDGLKLTDSEMLQKKSCLKTYHRFLVFGALW